MTLLKSLMECEQEDVVVMPCVMFLPVTFAPEVVHFGACTKSHLSYAKLDMGDQICVFIVEVYCWFIILCDYFVKFALLWNME